MAQREIPFYTHRELLLDLYGHPLQRVPIDPGFGCPHRLPDGTGGCTFCAPDGSRAPHISSNASIEDQIMEGASFAKRRYKAKYFMAYVQAHTGTNATPEEQRKLYRRILSVYPFEALTIATRPDCLQEPTLDLLTELKKEVDVWVEVGVQTTNDVTLRSIARGHSWATARQAIEALAERKIRVVAHAIIGLPGERSTQWRRTAHDLAHLPLTGVKIHNLHVIEGSELARRYERKPFPILTEADYADALIEFLRVIPPNFGVLRINTDTPIERLIAPRWGMDKSRFRDFVIDRMEMGAIKQGDHFR